jgi:hypothetical protein
MRNTYIDPSAVEQICDRIMAADFDSGDLKESHYRTLVDRLGQVEAERDELAATVVGLRGRNSALTTQFDEAKATCDRLARELGHDQESMLDDRAAIDEWYGVTYGPPDPLDVEREYDADEDAGVYDHELGPEPDRDEALGLRFGGGW